MFTELILISQISDVDHCALITRSRSTYLVSMITKESSGHLGILIRDVLHINIIDMDIYSKEN